MIAEITRLYAATENFPTFFKGKEIFREKVGIEIIYSACVLKEKLS
jgi:hypothetical protein